MIKNPYALAFFLLAIEAGVLYLASHKKSQKYFDIIPSVFWMYFLPMLASSTGLIDSKSPLYSQATNTLLPMSLFILLLTVDVRAIVRLGPAALLMFFAGGVGIGIGVCISFWLFKPLVGAEFWAGFGALSASWTGGSANMIAVKEALGTPDAVFLPMVIVDTIVPYVWMGLLVILAGHQAHFDRFNRADRRILEDLSRHMTANTSRNTRMSLGPALGIVLLAVAGGLLAQTIGRQLPVIKDIISTYAWTIIVVSTLAIALSFTPLKTIERHGSNTIGYWILYFVLTTIGAKAGISHIGSALVLIAAGFVIVAIHALVLFAAARLLRAPLFLAAVASQANIGGVASAPMVAEIYQKGFASVGLLLAILGNILGTYIGIGIGQLCRLLS